MIKSSQLYISSFLLPLLGATATTILIYAGLVAGGALWLPLTLISMFTVLKEAKDIQEANTLVKQGWKPQFILLRKDDDMQRSEPAEQAKTGKSQADGSPIPHQYLDSLNWRRYSGSDTWWTYATFKEGDSFRINPKLKRLIEIIEIRGSLVIAGYKYTVSKGDRGVIFLKRDKIS